MILSVDLFNKSVRQNGSLRLAKPFRWFNWIAFVLILDFCWKNGIWRRNPAVSNLKTNRPTVISYLIDRRMVFVSQRNAAMWIHKRKKLNENNLKIFVKN